MKKIVLGAAFVAAAGFGTFTANQSNNQAQMSDLQMENIEALAQNGESSSMCETGCLDRFGNGCFCYRYWPDLARP